MIETKKILSTASAMNLIVGQEASFGWKLTGSKDLGKKCGFKIVELAFEREEEKRPHEVLELEKKWDTAQDFWIKRVTGGRLLASLIVVGVFLFIGILSIVLFATIEQTFSLLICIISIVVVLVFAIINCVDSFKISNMGRSALKMNRVNNFISSNLQDGHSVFLVSDIKNSQDIARVEKQMQEDFARIEFSIAVDGNKVPSQTAFDIESGKIIANLDNPIGEGKVELKLNSFPNTIDIFQAQDGLVTLPLKDDSRVNISFKYPYQNREVEVFAIILVELKYLPR